MNPVIRIVAVMFALVAAGLIARAAWPAVAANLIALKSWNRAQGEVAAMPGNIEFTIGQEPDAHRAFAAVDHTWGLSLFKKVPVFLDPADPSHVKPAGFLQMWLIPAGMSAFFLIFLFAAAVAARYGAGQAASPIAGAAADSYAADSQWMFTASPGPLPAGIALHSPVKQWKIVLGWSLLGLAMAVIPIFAKGGNPLSRTGIIALGSAFTLALWGFAWHTKTLEITANDQAIRMTSILGWREVPWAAVHGLEDQDIFTTYYNGQTRMWELPFPGSSTRVFAFTGQRGRTLMTFSPELEPKESVSRLFQLCTARTGVKPTQRNIAIKY